MERRRRGRDYKLYVEEEHYTKQVYEPFGVYKQYLLQGENEEDEEFESVADWDLPSRSDLDAIGDIIEDVDKEEEGGEDQPVVYKRGTKKAKAEGEEELGEGEEVEAEEIEEIEEVEEVENIEAEAGIKKQRPSRRMLYEWPSITEYAASLTPEELLKVVQAPGIPKDYIYRDALDDKDLIAKTQRELTKEYQLKGADVLMGKTREVRKKASKSDE